MASGYLALSDWLREFEDRAQAFVRDERPDSLIEFEVASEERERLYREVGKHLPWMVVSDCPAALTVAAVQAAADAEEGDEAYIRHFLGRVGRSGERTTWDGEYGPATERFFEKHFSHRRKSGPWRYVRTVFMHAGIVVAGIRAYAEMLSRLLVRGTEFTYAEHLTAARGVSSTLVRPFLLTQTGFKFSRTTGQYLRRYRRGEVSVQDLELLRGYRPGFWSELLKHLKREIGSQQSKNVPAPQLALDHERGFIVLRFPREWQVRGIYRVQGHPVTYPDQRVAGSRPTHVQIGQQPAASVSPWWGPGMSPIAVFRAGDGTFLGGASPGTEQPWTLRAGTCFIVAEQSLAPALEELQALPLGVLNVLPQDDGEPPYDIWQADLSPASAYPVLGLKTVGREALPTLSFTDKAGKTHPFGPTVFAGKLPAVRVSSWNAESRARFAVRLLCDGKEQELAVPAGTTSYDLPVTAPCQGRVWLEPRGYSSVAEALGSLEFTLIPHGLTVRAGEPVLSSEEQGHVVAELPLGWELKALTAGVRGLDDRTWLTPQDTRVFDALLSSPSFKLPISVRLPVASVAVRNGDDVVWLEDLRTSESPDCDLDGPAYSQCDITLQDHERSVPLVAGLRLGEAGNIRLKLRGFIDAIDAAGMPVGRVVLHFGSRSIATEVWIGSLERLSRAVSPWHDDVSISEMFAREVPQVGPSIVDLVRLKQEPAHEIAMARLTKVVGRPGTFRTAAADCVHLAELLEQTIHDLASDVVPSSDVSELVEFVQGRQPTLPECAKKIAVCRWRDTLTRLDEDRNDEMAAGALLAEWRTSLRTGEPSRLEKRPGGYQLTDAARRYCQASVLPAGKLRNQALNTVLTSLERSLQLSAQGKTVHTTAAILRQVALIKSGRGVEVEGIALLHRPAVLLRAINELRAQADLPQLTCAPDALGLSDVLPSDCLQLV